MSESTRAPVLVLNQNYQPLNICDIRRAVKLVGKGKAQSVQESGEYLYTVDDIFDALAAAPPPAAPARDELI